jgi:hypothetical protein
MNLEAREITLKWMLLAIPLKWENTLAFLLPIEDRYDMKLMTTKPPSIVIAQPIGEALHGDM